MDVKDVPRDRLQHHHHNRRRDRDDEPEDSRRKEGRRRDTRRADEETRWSQHEGSSDTRASTSELLSFDQLIASPVHFDDEPEEWIDYDALLRARDGQAIGVRDRLPVFRDSDPTDELLLRSPIEDEEAAAEAAGAFPFTLLSTIEEEDEERSEAALESEYSSDEQHEGREEDEGEEGRGVDGRRTATATWRQESDKTCGPATTTTTKTQAPSKRRKAAASLSSEQLMHVHV